MKRLKFMMAGCLFALLVAVAVVKVNLKYGVADTGGLNLTNAEALAQGEVGHGECAGSGSIICSSGTYKVRYN